jgi:voltage-gated potassium channel
MLGTEVHLFAKYSWRVRGTYLVLLVLILVGAVCFTMAEGIPIGDSVYFAFITGLTIGYGDIVPQTPIGQMVSVLLGFVGLLFTGLVIAIAVRAVREAAAQARGHE